MAPDGMAVIAVLLTLVATLDAIDQQSDSFPTLGRLVTLDPENVVETVPSCSRSASRWRRPARSPITVW